MGTPATANDSAGDPPAPLSCPVCSKPVVIPPELLIPRTQYGGCKNTVALERSSLGEPCLIAVDGPEFRRTRARWRQIQLARKWGALLFVGAALFGVILLPWVLNPEGGPSMILRVVQLMLSGPLIWVTWLILRKEYHNEFDDAPRRRRRAGPS